MRLLNSAWRPVRPSDWEKARAERCRLQASRSQAGVEVGIPIQSRTLRVRRCSSGLAGLRAFVEELFDEADHVCLELEVQAPDNELGYSSRAHALGV